MHGLGNDFVIFDGRHTPIPLTPETIRQIAHRRTGIGCDQVILMLPTTRPEACVVMKIYNPDGSEAGACGNATRCVADILLREKAAQRCIIDTAAGPLTCERAEMNRICVAMTRPCFDWRKIPLAQECDPLRLPLAGDPVALSMGNPHCVFFVEDIKEVSVETLGPSVEKNPLFPERTNVEFAQIMTPERIRMRVWERGAGLTPACGSGACATLVAAVRRRLAARRAEMILDGGSLTLEWADNDAPVLMTGPVTYVFDGEINFNYLSTP